MVKWNSFIFLVSFLNALSFCFVVGMPTFFDPLYTSHTYKPQYPLGHNILAFSLPIFVVTYAINVRRSQAHSKALLTFSILFGFSMASIPNFQPIPNMWIIIWALAYGLILACTNLVHHLEVDLSYVSNKSIHTTAKIEKLKIEHEAWARALILIISSVGLITTAVFFNWPDLARIFYSTKTDLELFMAEIWLSFLYFVGLTALLAVEIFNKMVIIGNAFKSVPSHLASSRRKLAQSPRRMKLA